MLQSNICPLYKSCNFSFNTVFLYGPNGTLHSPALNLFGHIRVLYQGCPVTCGSVSSNEKHSELREQLPAQITCPALTRVQALCACCPPLLLPTHTTLRLTIPPLQAWLRLLPFAGRDTGAAGVAKFTQPKHSGTNGGPVMVTSHQ